MSYRGSNYLLRVSQYKDEIAVRSLVGVFVEEKC